MGGKRDITVSALSVECGGGQYHLCARVYQLIAYSQNLPLKFYGTLIILGIPGRNQ